MADYFDPNVEDDADAFDNYKEASKEVIVLLVDASNPMRSRAGLTDVEGFLPEDTFMDLTVKIIRELLKQHVIGSPKDRMALLFYGAREENNSISFPAIYTFQPLGETTAERIKEVEALLGSGFDEQVGSVETTSGEHLRDGLWAASQVFSSAKMRASKRLMVFTTEQDPSSGDSTARERIVHRAQQLKEAQVEIQVFNLTPEGQQFDMKPLWRDVAFTPEGETRSTESEPLRIQDVMLHVRRKSYKKRALNSLLWTIGQNLDIAVNLYALIQKATASKSVTLDLKTNEVVHAEGAFICNDTGAVLERIDKYSFPKAGTAPNFPTIIFSAEERQAFKALKPPGLRLLGFKPLSCLRPYHQLRSSTFVYPDEKRRPGSTTLFIALHDRLLHRELFALASVVRSQASEPRLAALVAQQEEIDEHGVQLTPPGLDMIWLPYADDLRAPENDYSFMGDPPYERASDDQVAAATKMLRKIQLHGFVPGNVPNPHLQRHYGVIEALALGEEPPEFTEKDDLTLPDNEGMQRVAKEEIAAFRDSVYGKGNDGSPKPTPKKRKAEDADEGPPDFQALAKTGNLQKLTLPPLKDFCKRNHLSTNGRKDDIVQRITAFLESKE